MKSVYRKYSIIGRLVNIELDFGDSSNKILNEVHKNYILSIQKQLVAVRISHIDKNRSFFVLHKCLMKIVFLTFYQP